MNGRSLGSFFGWLAVVWIGAWLPVGLWVGDLDYVLTPVSRGTPERQFYQIALYLGLLAVFAHFWRQHRPAKPGWGKPFQFVAYFAQGLMAAGILRWSLSATEQARWGWVEGGVSLWLQVVLGCLAVALVEEAVFRGFLLGKLVEALGWRRGVWLTSALFASVHLFRPGGPLFKVMYGVGLVLLGYLLARIAWHHDSISASAGFHGGLIFLNLATSLEYFQPGFWSGRQSEPVSGAISVCLTLAFLGIWSRICTDSA